MGITYAQVLTANDNNDGNVIMVIEDTDLQLWEIEWRPTPVSAMQPCTEETGIPKVGWKYDVFERKYHKPGGGPDAI